MQIKRNILNDLLIWKNKKNRKPLILRGARQVGKTTIIKEFGDHFKNFIHLNLEKKEHYDFFERFDNVNDIIEAILLSDSISKSQIRETLLFIDEIQESPKAISLLRFFLEDLPDLYVVSAGSLLEFSFHSIKSFPVGRIEYLNLYPINFQEFLLAMGKNSALEALRTIPLKPTSHKILLDLFHIYAIIGGMPEIAKEYIESGTFSGLQNIYESIWETYKYDIEKYASNSSDERILKHIIGKAHLYLDQRIKFENFGNSNYRSREVGESFQKLNDARVIQLVYPTTSLETPIIPDIKKSPRMQFLDTGIVNYELGIQSNMIGLKDMSNLYKGALIPHLVIQEYISLNNPRHELPNFWVREKKQSQAELDLLVAYKDKLIPIEIKSGKSGTLRSLHQFIEMSGLQFAVRLYAGQFSIEEHYTPRKRIKYKLLNLPYYMGTMIQEYIKYYVEIN